MSFYIFVVVLSIVYLLYLCWQTRFKSEHYIRYSKICESGILDFICKKYQLHLNITHGLFALFLMGFYWCVYQLCLNLGWQMWEMYVFNIFCFIGSYVYFLKKQLLLVLAEKYVLHV